MGQSELTHAQPAPRKAVGILLTVGLWLTLVLLSLMSIFALREVVLWALAAILTDPDPVRNARTDNIINFAHQCMIPIFGVVALAIVIFSSEYVFRHAGQPRALRLLFMIVAVEAAIVLPVWYLFWRP